MLLFEAKSVIDTVLDRMSDDSGIWQPELKEALTIASKCMEKQQNLIDVLNDWDIDWETDQGTAYSAQACHDIVRQFCIEEEGEGHEE